MYSFTILSLLAAVALAAPAPQSAPTPNSGAFTTWGNTVCSDQDGTRVNHQNIPDQTCTFLPGGSLQVDFLRAPSCEFRVYTSSNSCAGTPAAVYKANSGCHDILQFFSYEIVC